jgi:enamine deaminase RidA (YjgF/YER057c/UK114 family)
MVSGEDASEVGAERRLIQLGLQLPPPPSPLGAYVEAVKVGNLLFLSGMLPVIAGKPQFVGHVGGLLTVEDGCRAAQLACLGGLSTARTYLGSLDRITAVAKLGVYIATAGDFRDHARVADGASQVLLDLFGSKMLSGRIVLGVASLPLGLPIEVELVFETSR